MEGRDGEVQGGIDRSQKRLRGLEREREREGGVERKRGDERDKGGG